MVGGFRSPRLSKVKNCGVFLPIITTSLEQNGEAAYYPATN